MKIDLEKQLLSKVSELGKSIRSRDIQWPRLKIETDEIRALMINEVVPPWPLDNFFGGSKAAYFISASRLFAAAGIAIENPAQFIDKGIYLTNAVKTPKTDYTIDNTIIESQLDILECEIDSFPKIDVIMLMGDVAKKAFNKIAKRRTGKNALPAGSTYKIRKNEFFYEGIRIIPSYIMTGDNIRIEKSKFAMVAEDIGTMMRLLAHR